MSQQQVTRASSALTQFTQRLQPQRGVGRARLFSWLVGLAAGALLLMVFSPLSPIAGTPAANAPQYGTGGQQPIGEYASDYAAAELSAIEAEKRLEALRTSRDQRIAEATPTWVNPVPTARFTSCFCARWGTFHNGIDLAAPIDTPILAVGDGVVVKAGPEGGYGTVVLIQHENGDVSLYAHMYSAAVKPGDIVVAGQQIAGVGNAGYSTGPHLHLEIRQGGPQGQQIDPLPWLAERGVVIPTV